MRAYILPAPFIPDLCGAFRPLPALRALVCRAGWTVLVGSLLLGLRVSPVGAEQADAGASLPSVSLFDIVCRYKNQTYTLHGKSVQRVGGPASTQYQSGVLNDLDYRFPTGTCSGLCAYFDPYTTRLPLPKDEPRLKTLPSETIGGVLCRVLELSDPPPPTSNFTPAVPPLAHARLRWFIAPGGQPRRVTGSFQLFRPDGKTADPTPLVMEADYTFRDVTAGAARPGSTLPLRALQVPLEGENAVRALACSPTSPLLAVAANNGSVTVWNTDTLNRVYSLSSHPGWGRSLVCSGDGRRLAGGTIAQSGVVDVWDMQTGNVVQTIDTKSQGIFCLALSPDGRLLATIELVAQGGTPLQIWDVASGKVVASLMEPGAVQVVFAPDGKTLAAGAFDTVHLWDTAAWTQKRSLHQNTFTGAFGDNTPLTFSPDSKLLAVGDTHNNGFSLGLLGAHDLTSDAATVTRIWDTQTGKLLQTLSGTTGPVQNVAFSPDGATLAVADPDTSEEGEGKNSAVLLWDTRTWKPKGTTALEHGKSIRIMAWTADGRALVTSYSDKSVKFWAVPAM